MARRSKSVLDGVSADTAFLSKEELIQLILERLKNKTTEELAKLLQTL